MSIYEKEFFAATREEAMGKAAEFFGVDETKLEVRELSTLQIDGIGDRSCFVVGVEGMADKQPAEGPRRERRDRGDRDRDRDRDRGRGRDRDRGRGGRDRDRGGRDRDRDDRGRGRRPRGDKPEGVDHEKFEGLAQDAAEQVLGGRENVLLDPMSSKERWVVHNHIKDIDGVTSESEGDGADKRIRVFPE